MNDARQLRLRQKRTGIDLHRSRVDEESGPSMIVARIVSIPDSSAWPPVGPYPVRACELTGGSSFGSTLTATAVGEVFYATKLQGVATPPNPALGTDANAIYVIVTTVDGASVFEYFG